MTINDKLPADPPPPSRLDGLARRAALVLLVERLWPVLVLAAAFVAVFVALSWLGAWNGAPRAVRVAGVAALAAGLAGTVLLGVRASRVTRREALARLDRDSGSDHRPASSLQDTLATGTQDPLTVAMWETSRRRLEAAVRRLRVRPPKPRLAERDPYAIRAAVVLVLVAAGFVAGNGKDGLVAAAFDWRGPGPAAVALRVDAWVDPPGYTGRAPLVLFGGGVPTPPSLAVPVHSAVVVRSSGSGAPDVTASGGLKPVEAPPPDGRTTGPSKDMTPPPGGPPSAAAVVERRFVLDRDCVLTLDTGSGPAHTVRLTATPDLPPTIAMTGPLRPTDRGGLTLAYTIGDDYGVTAAEATFGDPLLDGAPPVRALVPAPKLPLNLPPTAGGLGAGQTTGDLSDHPWAGAEVTAVLTARDEGGNLGSSAPVRVTLPARPFTNPLARALVEQRRALVFDPDHRDGLATALDALMIEPDRFTPSKATYLGLYTARQRLAAAHGDDDLVSLADYLWQMALHLEEGDKTDAQRDLQAAEQALREAMARNAPPEEMRRLTDQLRKAMDRMLAEMARNPAARNDAPPDPGARTVTPDQLRQMMQRMEDLARSGNVAEAQRMLDRLQSMLDNLQTARRNGPSEARREMNRQMGELDKMTRDQQALRDRTFRQDRDQPGGDEEGDEPSTQGKQAAPKDGAPEGDGPADLQRQQQALRDRLSDLQRRMRQLGMKGEKGFDDAETAMKEAEGALGEGQGGNRKALDAQGRALQGLQQGANGVARQMAEGQGEPGGTQQGEREGSGDPSMSQGTPGQDGNDPLGRPRDGRGTMETRGPALEEGVAERAQRVLQELRRRLGDPGRPAAETDYLERLLQPY